MTLRSYAYMDVVPCCAEGHSLNLAGVQQIVAQHGGMSAVEPAERSKVDAARPGDRGGRFAA